MNQFQVDFFVVGAARSGTTSLYQYLKQHPEIFLPEIKELNYFSEVESNDFEDYKKPIAGKSYHTKIIKDAEVYEGVYEDALPTQKKGDVSPSYMWDPATADRIFQHNPNAKIIITLRNPADRAFSHYVMNLAVGYDSTKTFKEALEHKNEKTWGGGKLYKELGYYHKAVKSFVDRFGSEQVEVLIFEDWLKNKEETFKKLFDFLGVDQEFCVDHTAKHNEKTFYKNMKVLNFLRSRWIKKTFGAVMSSETRDRLKDRFFSKEEVDLQITDEERNLLKDSYRNDVLELQELLDIPLLEKWDMN